MKNSNNQGTCWVQFIVNENGKVSEVEALTMKNSKLSQIAVKAIKESPAWKPATQNGHIVIAYKKLPITFKMSDNIFNKEPQ